MKMNVANLRYLVKTLKPLLVGSYIHKFVEYSKTDYLFNVSKNKEKQVIISLQSSRPFLLLGQINDLTSSLSSSFFLQLRKEVEHAYIKDINLLNNDRIISIEIEAQNEIYEINRRFLILELITGMPNLLLLDEDNSILLAYRSTSFEQERTILKGVPYTLPNKNSEFNDNNEEIPFDINQEFNDYYKTLIEKRRKDKFYRINKVIKQNIKSLKTKIKKQTIDLENAENGENFKLYGDLLFTYMYEIKEYTSPLVLDEISIPLDLSKSLKDNALIYYKKYQKSKSALEHLIKQLTINKEELEYFLLLENQYAFASERDLLEIEEELIENGYLKQTIIRKKKSKKAYEPYFIYYKDTKIGYGKNNLQNDYLTFTLASKKDCYLHILNHPGSHIVIFNPNPSKEVIEFACALSLFLANKDDGDVIFTKVNELSKTSKKGLVTFKHYQTLHISSYDRNLFTSLH